MSRFAAFRFGVCFSLAVAMGLVIWMANAPIAAQEPAADATGKPVEEDMHEFMEYAFQPTYLRLKTLMAKEPDNAGWKGIKSDALILAEGGNLLLMRVSEEDPKAWKTMSKEVRDLGEQLYVAGKKKDFAAATKHYQAMITSCNACHTTFAGGEHQLKP